jgi:hypothetical protein
MAIIHFFFDECFHCNIAAARSMHSKQATSTQSIVLVTLAVLVALAAVVPFALAAVVPVALAVRVALVVPVALAVLVALVSLGSPAPLAQPAVHCSRLEPCMHGTSDTHAGSATRTVHTPPSSVADASSLLSLRDTTTLACAALGRTT